MRRAVVLVLATIGLLMPSVPVGGQCVELDDLAEMFARSDAVFVGTVIAQEPTAAQDFHLMPKDIVTLRLERSWKGARQRVVRVGSDGPFEIGKKYLVFADGKPLTTSIQCKWTEPIGKATRKLDWLSTQPSQPVSER
jgi:hypothetical protein